MNAVTVSPKYQVVIPRSVRERIQLQPGERLRSSALTTALNSSLSDPCGR